jgi:hypothetical protein
VKHRFNGRRLSECDLKDALTAIVMLPLNGMFPPIGAENASLSGFPAPMVRPLQQVTLRPDMLSAEGYLRLGSTPGDEANCWIHPQNIEVVEVLGRASWEGHSLKVDDAPDELRAAA